MCSKEGYTYRRQSSWVITVIGRKQHDKAKDGGRLIVLVHCCKYRLESWWHSLSASCCFVVGGNDNTSWR